MMGSAICLRVAFDEAKLRLLARQTREADQARGLLALASIYDGGSRTDAVRLGSVTVQIVLDWVLRVNDRSPDGLINGKAPGKLSLLNDDQRSALAKATEAEHPSRWAAISSIAAKIGCSAHTLNEWVKRAEVDSGKRAGLPSDIAEKMKALEREKRKLRQVNEILHKASAYFAQAELDRPLKR